MLPTKEFLTVCYKASCVAEYFLSRRHTNPITPRTFFDNPAQAVQVLEKFISRETGIGIVPMTLPNEYASWLIADGTGSMSIAIDPIQLMMWFQQTKKPIEQQRILSLIHEFAHTQITPRLAEGITEEALPKEEERAWVYTYVFLSIVCGHYSFRARTVSDVDDIPKYII